MRNVALTGAKSRNGYCYSEQALRGALPLYENKPVFLDHASGTRRPHERSTRDLAGSIVNVRFEENRIRGDIQALETDAGKTLLALAASDSPAVGMSHVVLAQRTADRTSVERIHDVVSVDAVVFPATAATFRESDEGNATARTPLPGSAEELLAQIDRALPDHVERLAGADWAEPRRVGLFADRLVVEGVRDDAVQQFQLGWEHRDGQIVLGETLDETTAATPVISESVWAALGALQHLRRERDELRGQLDELQVRRQTDEQQQHVERLLEETQLPGFAITETLRRQLLDAEDDAERRALLTERRTLIDSSRRERPGSSERRSRSRKAPDDDAFVAAVRHGPRLAAVGLD